LSIADTISDVFSDMGCNNIWVDLEKVEVAKGRVHQVLHHRGNVNYARSVQVEVALKLVVKCFSQHNVILVFKDLSKFLRQYF
jgi:hypothetical protein